MRDKCGIEEQLVTVSNLEVSKLISLLKSRLPESSQVYNIVLNQTLYPAIQIYTIGGDLSQDAVVIAVIHREDLGQDISISTSNTFISNESVKSALKNTKSISWDEAYMCTAIDRRISKLIFEISTEEFKNSVLVNPNYCYYYKKDDALRFEPPTLPGVEVKTLKNSEEGLEFLTSNWKYNIKGTKDYVKRVLDKGLSIGVFYHGKIVSGVIANAHGLIGLLYTNPNYRGRGYAKTCMQALSKLLAENGFIPCSSSQQKNFPSVRFHESLGMELTHESDYFLYRPYDFK